MRKSLLLLAVLALSFTWIQAQQLVTSGKVTDEKGDPIPGASVLIKGSKTGTHSNTNGEFSLQTPPNATLVILAVGYARFETKAGGSNIATRLTSEAGDLADVIVSGVASATSRKNMTVSVTKINEEQLSAVPATSAVSALTGKVAGLKTSASSGVPGSGVSLQLRADNNLTNVGSDPMIVVDGVILNGSLTDINGDDIESIEVVKGASAASLYGSRAGNGALVVTTKRGGKLANNATRITIRNEVGMQQIRKQIKLATHHAYKLASDWATYKGVYTKYQGVTYPAGYTDAGYSPALVGNRPVDDDRYADNDYAIVRDQQDEFFTTGTNYTNFVSLASKSGKTSFYGSFENSKQEGVIKMTSGYKRQNYRLNIDHQINPWLKLSATNLFISTSSNYTGSGGGAFFNIVLTEPDVNLKALNPDGQPYYLRSSHWNATTTNPLYDLYKNQRDDKRRRWIGNYTANVKFTYWANLDVSQSIEIENYRYTYYSPKNTWQVDATGSDDNMKMSYTLGSLTKSSSESSSKNTQVTLNLAQKFGNLDVKGKLSYLYENKNYDYNSTSASDFVFINTPVFDNFKAITSATSNATKEEAQNYFAILSLNWKDKFLIDGMGRYDGSSLFGPNKRWNPYYRVSGAYRISKDVYIPGIDELKIRAAYGTAGIRPDFSWQYEYFDVSSGAGNALQVGNKNLRPSVTKEKELAINVEFLKKFTFEAIYAQSKTTDQFLNVNLLPFLNAGHSQQYQNAGAVESKSLEFTLGASWIRKKDFSWNSNITFSRIRQKITELPIPAYKYGGSNGGPDIFYARTGETYGVMYGYDFVRSLDQMAKQLPSGKSISDYALNSEGYVIAAGTEGKSTEAPIKVKNTDGSDWYGKIGDGNAKFNLGLANTLSYKGITFYFLIDVKNGGDVYNSKSQWLTRDYRNAIMDMSGVEAGKKKTVDYYNLFYDVNLGNKYWVENGGYIKLREVAIGYNWVPGPKSILNNVFKGITGKVIGRNLATITDYSGYDPEVGSIRTPYDGINQYPNFRNIAFSLAFNF